MFACTCQQKGFGTFLKSKVWVRQMVGINSKTIRVMKIIISRPGLDLAKVAILVGGPDWPTSVLCGLMGLPLLPVLIGTLPVFILIVPTVLSGTFLYLAALPPDEEEPEGHFPWAATMATIMATCAGAVQTASMVLAAAALEKAYNDPELQKQIDDIPETRR